LILVDRERCTACGTCAEICHTRCMSVTDDSVEIEHALCSTCGSMRMMFLIS
jgi:uncharacterized Fe-S center protein